MTFREADDLAFEAYRLWVQNQMKDNADELEAEYKRLEKIADELPREPLYIFNRVDYTPSVPDDYCEYEPNRPNFTARMGEPGSIYEADGRFRNQHPGWPGGLT